jgi:hypothetical protein
MLIIHIERMDFVPSCFLKYGFIIVQVLLFYRCWCRLVVYSLSQDVGVSDRDHPTMAEGGRRKGESKAAGRRLTARVHNKKEGEYPTPV